MAFIIQYRQLHQSVRKQLQNVQHLSEESANKCPPPVRDSSVKVDEKKEHYYSELPGISIQVDHNGNEYFQVGWATPQDPFCPQ